MNTTFTKAGRGRYVGKLLAGDCEELTLDCVDFVAVEGDVVLDVLRGLVRLVVCPRTAIGLFVIDGDVEITGHTFPMACCVLINFRKISVNYGSRGEVMTSFDDDGFVTFGNHFAVQ